ncbi:hypothetical protein ACET3Z_032669 [Daucus carota]
MAKGFDTEHFDQCVGRYIYVHDLPSKFNVDFLKNCSARFRWSEQCDFLSNFGLGLETTDSGDILQNRSWYATYQFVLEVIFHSRMKMYKCLTNESALASAIFVPFYPGLDLLRYLRDDPDFKRDSNSIELVKWLTSKKEWKRMQGQDHFFVSGRTTWDFHRLGDNQSGWGNVLLELSETKNMTILVPESKRWSKNEYAIPYPTYFHPSRDSEVFQWQSKMKKAKRPYLYAFVGASRPKSEQSIRSMIIDQCLVSGEYCSFYNCRVKNCKNPVNVISMLQRSKFCLQPSGDTATRRSTFDSILAGCIPVFFNPKSAYIQYKWHLPQNYSRYSVYIPEKKVRQEPESIEMILKGISRSRVRSMREEVIGLIPRIIYADPRSSLDSLEDAFDIAVRGVLERVDRIRKE